MMYDDLVKRLRRCEQFRCRECEYEQVMGCRAKLNEEAADAIEELSRDLDIMNEANIALYGALPKWIPVTERLPEPYSGEYLVAINDGSIYVDILWFDSPGGGRYDSCFYKSDDDGYANICTDVIAWMPLPEPPKEET